MLRTVCEKCVVFIIAQYLGVVVLIKQLCGHEVIVCKVSVAVWRPCRGTSWKLRVKGRIFVSRNFLNGDRDWLKEKSSTLIAVLIGALAYEIRCDPAQPRIIFFSVCVCVCEDRLLCPLQSVFRLNSHCRVMRASWASV